MSDQQFDRLMGALYVLIGLGVTIVVGLALIAALLIGAAR